MSGTTGNIHDFSLTVGDAIRDFAQLPVRGSVVYYHYTSRAGLIGILKDGGLRASYRLKMNDDAEFGYARKVVDESLSRNDSV